MKEILLKVPAEVVAATRLPYEKIEKEYRKELAFTRYKRDLLLAGKARLLAQMTCWEDE